MQKEEENVTTLDNFVVVKTLGTGLTSKVKLGIDKETGKKYALKILRDNYTKAILKTFENEYQILQKIKSKNIVNIMGASNKGLYTKRSGATKTVIYLVIEFAENGELFDLIHDAGKGFSESQCRFFFAELIKGLETCHENGIAHRDLKPENLLFDKEWNLKITDFGFSTLLQGKLGDGKLNTQLGTLNYMAPEIHLKQKYSGSAVDIFAAGIILFIMATGCPPFNMATKTDNWYKTMIAERADLFWYYHRKRAANLSDEFKELMTGLLTYDPEKRITIGQIKQHKWFDGEVDSFEDIVADLENRRELVIKNKEQEKLAEKMRKELMKKRRNRFGNTNTGRNVYRADGDDDEDEDEDMEEDEEIVEKVMEKYIDSGNSCEIFLGLTPEEIEEALRLYYKDFDVKVSEEKFKVKVNKNCKASGRNVQFTATITQVDDDINCLEFKKKGGVKTDFIQEFVAFKKTIQNDENYEFEDEGIF